MESHSSKKINQEIISLLKTGHPFEKKSILIKQALSSAKQKEFQLDEATLLFKDFIYFVMRNDENLFSTIAEHTSDEVFNNVMTKDEKQTPLSFFIENFDSIKKEMPLEIAFTKITEKNLSNQLAMRLTFNREKTILDYILQSENDKPFKIMMEHAKPASFTTPLFAINPLTQKMVLLEYLNHTKDNSAQYMDRIKEMIKVSDRFILNQVISTSNLYLQLFTEHTSGTLSVWQFTIIGHIVKDIAIETFETVIKSHIKAITIFLITQPTPSFYEVFKSKFSAYTTTHEAFIDTLSNEQAIVLFANLFSSFISYENNIVNCLTIFSKQNFEIFKKFLQKIIEVLGIAYLQKQFENDLNLSQALQKVLIQLPKKSTVAIEKTTSEVSDSLLEKKSSPSKKNTIAKTNLFNEQVGKNVAEQFVLGYHLTQK